MIDKNRLKELFRSLDCNNLNPTMLEAIDEMLIEWNAEAGGI